MSRELERRGPCKTEPVQQSHDKDNTSACQIESMKRLYGCREPLTQLGAELAIQMKGRLPDEPLQEGKLYQLEGKQLYDVDCMSLLIFPNKRAIVIDLSTGVVASINPYGVKRTNLIGGRHNER